jgi:hypothetical protein
MTTDAPTPGVMLRAADGSHYFIPHTDLSEYTVEKPPAEVGEHLDQNAPRVDAFEVQRAGGDAPAAEGWLAEGNPPE